MVTDLHRCDTKIATKNDPFGASRTSALRGSANALQLVVRLARGSL